MGFEGEERCARNFQFLGDDGWKSDPDCEINENRLLMIASVVHRLEARENHSNHLSCSSGIDWYLALRSKLMR
jgi:hypothetical protein